MKKSIKIVLGSMLALIVVVIIYAILVIKGIFPNPFLDTKDLVCRVDNFYPVNEVDLVITFRFDKKALIKSYTESYIYVIDDEEKLKQAVEELKSNDLDFNINEHELTVYTDYYIQKDIGYYGKTKKEIKRIYSQEFLYTCE